MAVIGNPKTSFSCYCIYIHNIILLFIIFICQKARAYMSRTCGKIRHVSDFIYVHYYFIIFFYYLFWVVQQNDIFISIVNMESLRVNDLMDSLIKFPVNILVCFLTWRFSTITGKSSFNTAISLTFSILYLFFIHIFILF